MAKIKDQKDKFFFQFQAKVFTVFVLPLNSCFNPFLYAILTKQFKKDCVMICKAIEESRVTRYIRELSYDQLYRILTYFKRGSIIVQMTSCFTSAALIMLN